MPLGLGLGAPFYPPEEEPPTTSIHPSYPMAKSSPAPVSKDLVEWLERHYPDRLPLDLPSEQEVARLVGRQDVVRKLRREYETQYES